MTNFFNYITGNYVLNVAVVAWFTAQVLKTLFTFLGTKKLVLERMVGAGGMPSAHTAFVISLTVAMAKSEGFDSPIFALSLCFALVVMYDAMGVRRAAGEQAKVINKMIFSFKDISKIFDLLNDEIEEEYDDDTENIIEHKELKEFLGHTPLEVVGGALVGILVAAIMPM